MIDALPIFQGRVDFRKRKVKRKRVRKIAVDEVKQIIDEKFKRLQGVMESLIYSSPPANRLTFSQSRISVTPPPKFNITGDRKL